MNLFGQTVSVTAMLMFALAAFLLAGVYSLARQRILVGALIALVLAGLAVTAGVMQV
ncbi:MAG: hypothetical protein ABIS86_15710 [Streptosporangiaceae bacterium]